MAAERFEIDTVHSQVGFTVSHLVIAKVRGAFTRFAGSVLLDAEDVTASSVIARVETASIDTNEPQRDRHLRSADFLDVERYPEMVFASTRVEELAPRRLRVTGDLTLHGNSGDLVLDTTYGGRIHDPWGQERVGFEARGMFDRRRFGLVWNAALEAGGVLVGDQVEIEIQVEAVLAPAPL